MYNPMKCINCSKELTKNDIGMHKKMVNRGAREFMCIPCLSKYFHIPEEAIYKKIDYFKKMGCTLFN